MNFTWLLNRVKGYVVHTFLVGIVALNPSVLAWAGTHKAYSAVILLAYGYLLHWAQGKLGVPPTA